MTIRYIEETVVNKMTRAFPEPYRGEHVLLNYFAPRASKELVKDMPLRKAALADLIMSANKDCNCKPTPINTYWKAEETDRVYARLYIYAFEDRSLLKLLPKVKDAADLTALLAIDCMNKEDHVLRTKRELAKKMKRKINTLEYIARQLIHTAKKNFRGYQAMVKQHPTPLELEPENPLPAGHYIWTCEDPAQVCREYDWSKGLTIKQEIDNRGFLKEFGIHVPDYPDGFEFTELVA
ncbi:hypothetical protein KY362_03705 [Candidatus Woesearchaeota archaeon]|nr:hypothetical protein [Candidatus Woesearchaeota archaeon]